MKTNNLIIESFIKYLNKWICITAIKLVFIIHPKLFMQVHQLKKHKKSSTIL